MRMRASEGDTPTNRSAAIQLWLIGMLVPGILLALSIGMVFDGIADFDFSALWVAGRQALDGSAADVYSQVATKPYTDRLGVSYATNFPYPPHALFLYAPFAAIPYIPSYIVWNLFSGAIFLWAARPYLPSRLPLLFAILTPAALNCFRFGQTGLVLGALWLLAFRGKWPAVALMTFKPHMGMLSILSLRSRTSFVKTCVLAAAIVAASALVFGAALWLSFFDHLIGHGELVATRTKWQLNGVGPAMSYGYWGWIPFAAAGALMLARKVNVFTASTASFLISPFAFHYDMTVASLGFGLLAFHHWRDMPVGHRIATALGFMAPAIAIAGAWWVPPILLWALWIQVKYDVPLPAAEQRPG